MTAAAGATAPPRWRAWLLRRDTAPCGVRPRCGSCRHFVGDAQALEAASPGLAVLSSAHGAVLAGDGVCTLQARYLSADAACGQFAR